jgi:serine phosphatase RsbU (regulator of sigma subunit)
MNPLFVVQNNEMTEVKADKKSIGGQAYKGETERIFSKQTIDLMQASDTMIYLVTDGYQDQFGGEKGKKFMTKRFRELLFSIHNETMTKQKEILDHTIIKWIADGNETQTDDITVLGLKV